MSATDAVVDAADPIDTKPPRVTCRPAARVSWPNAMRMTLTHRFGGEGGLYNALAAHDFSRARVGNRTMVCVAHPDYLEAVLSAPQEQFVRENEFALFRSTNGGGSRALVTDDGESWARHRGLFNPVFAKRHINGLFDLMAEPARVTADRLLLKDVERIDITELMNTTALDVLGAGLFSRRMDDYYEASKGMEENNRAFDLLERAMFCYNPKPWMWTAFVRVWESKIPLPRVSEAQAFYRWFSAAVKDTVDDRRANPSDRPDLLNQLLQIRDGDKPLSDNRIRAEMMQFVSAGHETTSLTLSAMWWLLAQHPDVYDEMLTEVDKVLDGRLPTLADLPKLVFTQACFDEALRLYTPTWQTFRIPRSDMMIGSHHVAAGTSILIPVLAVHHDRRFWPNPERFDPSRFLPGAPERPRYSYIPFLDGRRICIGRGFALMEALLITALVSQRVRFEPIVGQHFDPEYGLILRPRNGLAVTVRRRQQTAR
jgi:cytochrome P450